MKNPREVSLVGKTRRQRDFADRQIRLLKKTPTMLDPSVAQEVADRAAEEELEALGQVHRVDIRLKGEVGQQGCLLELILKPFPDIEKPTRRSLATLAWQSGKFVMEQVNETLHGERRAVVRASEFPMDTRDHSAALRTPDRRRPRRASLGQGTCQVEGKG